MGYDLSFDKELILHFLLVFSRLEYAMKRAGFLVNNKKDAQADWDCFAHSIRPKFHSASQPDLEEACSYLRQNPPNKQVNDHGSLGWCPIAIGDGESDEAFLLRAVRVVRNNLFHGGKYPTGPRQDVARDHALLNASLTVLEHCRASSPEVNSFFEEGA
jgi:hypothetical protein